MGASIIASIIAFTGTAAAVGSAVATLLWSNKVKELRSIADNENLEELEENLGSAQILAWIGAALGLVTAIIFVTAKYTLWLKIVAVLVTLGALIGSIVLQGIGLGAVDRMGPVERDELRNYAIWAIVLNAVSMAMFMIAMVTSLFVTKPTEDIYKEGVYPGGIFEYQTDEELEF